MTYDWEKELARIQTDIRRLQQEMGIAPRTLEQRAADWNRRQEEIARAQARAATAPKLRFPKI